MFTVPTADAGALPSAARAIAFCKLECEGYLEAIQHSLTLSVLIQSTGRGWYDFEAVRPRSSRTARHLTPMDLYRLMPVVPKYLRGSGPKFYEQRSGK